LSETETVVEEKDVKSTLEETTSEKAVESVTEVKAET